MADENSSSDAVTAQESINEMPAADMAASTSVAADEAMDANHQDADGQVKGEYADADEAEQHESDQAGPSQIPVDENPAASSRPPVPAPTTVKPEPAEPSLPQDPRRARAHAAAAAAAASSPAPVKSEPQEESTPAPAEEEKKQPEDDQVPQTAPLQSAAHREEAMSQVNNFLASVQQEASASGSNTDLSTPAARRAHLLSRVEASPRDSEAWLTLLADCEARLAEGESIEQVRQTYEDFFKVYPNAARQWQSLIDLELSLGNFKEVEQLFTRCLRTTPSVSLWKAYLNYTRRVNPLPAPSATASGDDEGERGRVRKLIEEAYDFAVRHVGMSRDAGDIWMEYLRFVKEREAKTSWLQGQKMDDMRRIFQRVVGVPVANVEQIWREYDQFENVSRLRGRAQADKSASA